jgi:hypothetical protein
MVGSVIEKTIEAMCRLEQNWQNRVYERDDFKFGKQHNDKKLAEKCLN